MALKIIQMLVNRTDRVFGFNNRRKWITIHETDNYSRGAGALAHANFQKNGGGGASWQYQVDDQAAYQSYSHSAQCFHAGDGRGNGNMHSIAIEVCVNPDSDWGKTKQNLVELVLHIMKQEGVPASNVIVQHNHWSGKNCPRQMRANSNRQWNEVLAAIRSGKVPAATGSIKPPATSGKLLSTDAIAKEVIAGKWGNGQDRLQRLVDAGYNAITVQNRVNQMLGAGTAKVPAAARPARKATTTIAREVIAGKWGNGADRQRRLQAAGYSYSTVQGEVNRILAGGSKVASGSARKSNEQVANEVIYGLWGNGADRQRRLAAAGYSYSAVQAIVNRKLG